MVTSSFSFIASANVILHERATPIFADIDERTLNVDPAAVEAAITPRTRAIVPIHIFGYPCDIEAISRIAADAGVAVVEDACEALGWHGRRSHGRDAWQPGRLRLLPRTSSSRPARAGSSPPTTRTPRSSSAA